MMCEYLYTVLTTAKMSMVLNLLTWVVLITMREESSLISASGGQGFHRMKAA